LVPITVAAPGLFSTITVWPSVWVNFSPSSRATVSALPPAGNVTTMVIGRDG
jgi:hypothetical protein